MKIHLLAGLLLALCSPIDVAAQDAADSKEGEQASPKTAAESVQQINKLLSANKLAEAKEALDAARKQFPAQRNLVDLLYQFYLRSARTGNSAQAAKYIEELTTYYADEAEIDRATAMLASFVYSDLSLASRVGKTEAALERADKICGKLEAAGKPALFNTASQIRQRQAIVLAANKEQAPRAREIIEQNLKSFDERFTAEPDDAAAAVIRAGILRTLASVAARMDAEDADELNKAHATYMDALWAKHPEHPSVASNYIGSKANAIAAMARKEPYKAQEELDSLKATIGKLKEDGKLAAPIVSSFERTVASLGSRIEAARKHFDLIGKPAFPLEAEAWVNGSELSNDDLKGKVVLLDFWAVWCGPCIATFPHLREWNEHYADKGLVIIGLTRYYNYEWNDDTGRAQRAKEKVSPEDEQKMLEKFAALHDLHHRFMITAQGSTLSKDYGVTGIPQAVLIDQEGKVRLIRVGSGEANAQDISEMLEKLLGDGSKAGG